MKFLTRLGNCLRNLVPLDNPAPIVVVIAAFLLALALALALSHRAWGETPVIQLSTGRAVLRGPAPVLELAWDYPAGRGGDAWRSGLTLVGHSAFRGVNYPNSYMLSEQYVTGFGRLDLGLGAAYLANPLPYNGAHVDFKLSIGYRFSFPVAIGYEHYSCGGSCAPNLGRDMLLIGWRFR